MPVYTAFSARERRRSHFVSEIVPWRAVLAPGVVLQKDRHGLQRTYAMRGPDVQGESPEVQGTLMLQANQVLKRLGGRWMLHTEAQWRTSCAATGRSTMQDSGHAILLGWGRRMSPCQRSCPHRSQQKG